ncbi:ABC transporter permease [Oscillatoria amoena NRMC-F 0135]|nr:ABC transporter permease [Oscillatoria amoena NRMC-F 0135]
MTGDKVWFCPHALYEGIEGDLIEQFAADLKGDGYEKCKAQLVLECDPIFPAILRNRISIQFMDAIMLSNYFKVTTRNLAKSKLYSFINAFGLSIGIAVCLLIFLFIQDERSFDRFHSNKQ